MFMYCEKCAYIGNIKNKVKAKCPACETFLLAVPEEYLTSSGFMFATKDSKKELEDKIKQGEKYDANLGDNLEIVLAEKQEKRQEEINELVNEYNNSSFRVTCPICHSQNVDKISNLGKIVKVGALGILGAGDIGKIYKCKACGYRF